MRSQNGHWSKCKKYQKRMTNQPEWKVISSEKLKPICGMWYQPAGYNHWLFATDKKKIEKLRKIQWQRERLLKRMGL